jgi:carbon monoxide dehydrogenase subunit G
MSTLKIISKVGLIASLDEKVFNFASDFNNFKNFIPPEQAEGFVANGDTCEFTVKGMKMGLRIIEKDPFKTIKIEEESGSPLKFLMWIQLVNKGNYNTGVRVTIHADVNMMMKPMLKKPLQQFADGLVDGLCRIPYQ